MTPLNETTPLFSNGNERSKETEHEVYDEESNNGFQMTGNFSLSRSINNFSQHLSKHIGRIGLLGSMSIAVNSLTGPAMLNLPDTYQRAGFIPTTVTVVFVCILSALCCLHMANTLSKIPGNPNFKREVRHSFHFSQLVDFSRIQ
jgi:hypothetical protein